MSYIALARKWRPRTFSQLIGQDHITKALINSLNQQRLHHAYLFTGTRGVGKTSVARLLAKALNCEQGIRSDPCLQCDACLAIEQGRFIDLIEIDGASRTRVEDTREILENVQYAPTSGRFKIYLIDEVHMLSQHSFNALLKTLEEPPAHVKFILATTDPQKLPVTVLSRCLQFNLKAVQTDVICQHLQQILHDEQLVYDLSAVVLLAKAAHGSIRDALSLLDQAIASCPETINTHDVKNSLGYTQQDYALQLLLALAELAPHKLMDISQRISDEGGHFRYVLDEILSYLHQITVNQNLPDKHPLIASDPDIMTLCSRLTPEDVQLFYQIGLKGADDLALAPTMAIGFEMTLLRMYTFRPVPTQARPPLAYQVGDIAVPVKTAIHAQVIAVTSTETDPLTRGDDNDLTVPIKDEPELDAITTSPAHVTKISTQPSPHDNPTWSEILPQLHLTGLALNAAENGELLSKTEGVVTLRVAKGHQSVFTPSVINRIEAALAKFHQEKIKLILNSDEQVLSSPAQQKKLTQDQQHQNAQAALQNDPFFQQLQQTFSAELVKNSIA